MKKSYICFACRDGLHYLCAFDLNPKNPCRCNAVWHVERTEKGTRRFKGELSESTVKQGS